ncbi:MAG: family 16 glycoside hydrolase, partial [Verrucomicrobiales bacterium]
ENAAAEGFIEIFNGEDLTGWEGDAGLWRVEDGLITGETSDADPIPYNKFLIWRDGEVDDFELKVQYRILSGNSGIQYRSFPLADTEFAVGGYQADIDYENKHTGLNYGEKFRGMLARRGEKAEMTGGKKPEILGSTGDPDELASHIKTDDWNEYHIIARGDHLVQKINGVVMSELTDNDQAARRRAGLLAFQLHRGPAMKVQFRNIRLKRLPLENRKKIVFVAGNPSHGVGAHEHNAGCLLLARLLNENYGDQVQAVVYRNGWPADPTAFHNADALVMYCDGGARHVAYSNRPRVNALARRGLGIGCLHYGVEMEPGETNDDLTSWIGGAFEINYSVNPHWDAEFTSFPEHPVTRGVKPFTINDEWYFNMRFNGDMAGVTPILSAIAPESTMERPDGHHSGNPLVREMVANKLPQHVSWVYQRPDGGRGFGFTGAHYHANWANDDFRKTVLNAIAWIANIEIPAAGIETPTPSEEDLLANLDPGKKKTPKKRKSPAKAKAE